MTLRWSSAALPEKGVNDMGCVYRRKNSKNWWIKYSRNGKPYSESSHSAIKAVAEGLLKRRDGEIAQGRLPGVVFNRVTFDELAEDYLTEFRINKKRSISRAEHSVKTLRVWFGGMKVTQITTTEIRRYVDRRLQHPSETTPPVQECSRPGRSPSEMFPAA